jgi:CubicO group peptidase (beta-lactamase class C family)
MRKIIITTAHAIISYIVLSAQQTTQDTNLSARIDRYMQTVAVKEDGFSGCLLIARKGETLLNNGYGMANLEWNIPNHPQTVFSLGTFTSRFTQMGIMMLAENGKLSLQDPLKKFLQPCPSAWKDITVLQLLEHRSSIPNFILLPDFEKRMGSAFTPEEMITWIHSKPLESRPGEKFNFSNSNNYLLGLVIEKASGQNYYDFIRQQLFQPLGMDHTGFEDRQIVLNKASGYSFINDSLYKAPYVHPSVFYSAGAAWSTTGDLMKWDQALYTEKLVSRKSIAEMNARAQNAGYGEIVRELYHHNRIRYNEGYYGFTHNITRFPDDTTVIILLTNRGSDKNDKHIRAISAMLFGILPEETRIQEVKVDAEVLRQYVGVYEFAPERRVTITIDNGNLFMQGTNKPKKGLAPLSNKKFQIRGGEAFIVFEGNGTRPAASLEMHEASATITAVRVQ